MKQENRRVLSISIIKLHLKSVRPCQGILRTASCWCSMKHFARNEFKFSRLLLWPLLLLFVCVFCVDFERMRAFTLARSSPLLAWPKGSSWYYDWPLCIQWSMPDRSESGALKSATIKEGLSSEKHLAFSWVEVKMGEEHTGEAVVTRQVDRLCRVFD